MINLLPQLKKIELKAAHQNVILLKYLIITGISFAFLILIFIGAYFQINAIKSANEALANNNQSLSSQYSTIQNQINDISNNIANAKTVLSEQVSYSNLISSIASILPTGSILEKLSINEESLSNPINLVIYAKNAELAPVLKTNIESNPLFFGYNLQSVTPGGANIDYPVTITINININRGHSVI